ncbi:hypothetical protein BO85DRAFT_483728 [Aspergillus piperis CBS 112811]|uniref:Uncharacterized protein n=1 Tax=Aspergillus piperis CBS 112811 TaxID=1448313 RepID=A0A8G1VTD9_9EURO|nr:hypothetical protein BO85DRAFT_483728 [Aspergillus piperis CBS 112811]RAH61703.1 hypothetical protein BO85DRAFT_483728 [Aspergillus piperis CBS 112811]
MPTPILALIQLKHRQPARIPLHAATTHLSLRPKPAPHVAGTNWPTSGSLTPRVDVLVWLSQFGVASAYEGVGEIVAQLLDCTSPPAQLLFQYAAMEEIGGVVAKAWGANSRVVGMDWAGVGMSGRIMGGGGGEVVSMTLLRGWAYLVLPETDWMMMCSLRDSRGWFIDYEGASDGSGTVALDTAASELENWYNATGFFTNVTWNPYYEAGPSIDTLQDLDVSSTKSVALWVDSRVLGGGDVKGTTHIIGLTSKPQINATDNSIKFGYWTWGKPARVMDGKLDFIQGSIKGVFVATV